MAVRHTQRILQLRTQSGRVLDLGLIVLILLSTLATILESVASIQSRYQVVLKSAEVFFTVVFTAEYAVRLHTARRRRDYAFSFYGIVDLVSILPTYLGIMFHGARYLRAVKVLRLLRIFRILKLTQYLGEAEALRRSLAASARKILVFLTSVVLIVIVVGTVMHVIEGAESGFNDIPTSIYWTVVTITTVGYGDIAPQTALGQFVAAFVMLLGYSIIAIPTGIVTLELGRAAQRSGSKPHCPGCSATGHGPDALYCRRCGDPLPRQATHAAGGASVRHHLPGETRWHSEPPP